MSDNPWNNDQYEQNGQNQQFQQYQQNEQNNGNYYKPPYNDGFAIASLVLGIISLVLFCACCNIVTAILAVVFGIIHLTRTDKRRGMAIAGIVTASLSVILGIVSWVLLTTNASFANSFRGDMQDVLPYFQEGDSYEDFFEDYLEENRPDNDDNTY